MRSETLVYERWATSYVGVSPAFARLLYSLPWINIPQRKVLLTYTRVQPASLCKETTFYRRGAKELHKTIRIPAYLSRDTFVNSNLLELLDGIILLPQDPIIYGILSIAVRSAPLDNWDSAEDSLQSSLSKEIEAAQTHNDQHLSYGPWLDNSPLSASTQAVGANIPFNPYFARLIHRTLSRTKFLLQDKLFVPRVGRKTFGSSAQQLIQQSMAGWDHVAVEFRDAQSIDEVERLYHRHGVLVDGCTEMRSAWKFNDLKPRVYYAQGPSAYHASKYIQEIFNLIVDQFPCTNRFARFETPFPGNFPEDMRAIIYDYSSFTSNLTVIRSFTEALASFYDDVEVRILDTYSGIITTSLGGLIRDYNEVCNTYPEVDISRCTGGDDFFSIFHEAGMLGVPGNITSSTLLHGLLLASLVEDLMLCKCIGDDAFCFLRLLRKDGLGEERYQEFLRGVRSLGEVAEEKAVFWDHESDPDNETWHYTKRPISRFYGNIFRGRLVEMPSLELILNLKDDYHRPSKAMESSYARYRALLSQIRRTIDVIAYHCEGLVTDEGANAFTLYVNRAYDFSEMRKIPGFGRSNLLSLEGKQLGWCITHLRGRIGFPFKDMVCLDSWRSNGNVVTFRAREYRTDKLDTVVGMMGELAVVRSTKLLGLMRVLGYVEMETRYADYSLHILYDSDFLKLLLDDKYHSCYDCRVLEDFPSWYYSAVLMI